MAETEITPSQLLFAYAQGMFPMADDAQATQLRWYAPDPRGILPLNSVHISRSLRRKILKNNFMISINGCFSRVMRACADRPQTWINAQIIELYHQLHEQKFAHSLEVWDGRHLLGGIYGVTLGGAYFGESMFSARSDGSKLALIAQAAILRRAGFVLFDTQFLTPHLARMGAKEIPRTQFDARLSRAIQISTDSIESEPLYLHSLLAHRITQIS